MTTISWYRKAAPMVLLGGAVAACDAAGGSESEAGWSSGLEVHEGVFERWTHDEIDGSVTEYSMLRLDEQTAFELDFHGSDESALSLAERLSSGDALRVYGSQADGRLTVSHLERPDTETEVRTIRQALVGLGHRTAAVLLVGFEGTPNTYNPTAVQNAVFGSTGRTTNTFYLEGSRGQMKLVGIQNPDAGDVFGPYTVPYASCDAAGGFATVGQSARALADNSGVNTSAYDHIIHVLAPNGDCPGGGVAGGNRYTWLFGIGINSLWDFAAHEVGHNFGLPHSAWYESCTSRTGSVVTRSGPCVHHEYGDPTDVMGRRNYQFSSFFLERLRWLDESNALVLDQSRRVLLLPIGSESSGIQSLRIQRPGGTGGESFYHLEYRQPFGQFDSQLENTLMNGLLVRLVGNPTENHTPRLLDMTPNSQGGNNDTLDSTLVAGSSLQDGDLHVDVIEVTPDCVTVDVTFGGVLPNADDPVGSCGDGGVGGSDGTGGGGVGGSSGTGGAGFGGSDGTGGADFGGADGTGGSDATDGVGGAISGNPDGGVSGDEERTQTLEPGCSCRLAPSRQTWAPAVLSFLLLPTLWRRRRRSAQENTPCSGSEE